MTRLVVFVGWVVLSQSLYLLVQPDEVQTKINLVLQIALVAIFAVWSYRTSGTYLGAPFIVLASLYIWHSPFLTGHLFGLSGIFQETSGFLAVGSEYIPSAVALVGLCLVTTLFGVLFAFNIERKKTLAAELCDSPSEPARDGSVRAIVWVGLFGYVALTLAYFYFEGAEAFSEDYMWAYLHASDSLLARSYQATKFFVVPVVLCLFAFLGTRNRIKVLQASGIVAGLSVLTLMTGARSVAFISLLAMFVALDYFVRRHPLWIVIAAGVGTSAMSFIVVFARTTRVGTNVFNVASADKPIDLSYSLWEMGGTVEVLLRTMSLVANTGFQYGRSILDSIVYIAPRALVDGLGLRTGYTNPADWLVENSPDVPEGGGMGYSLVAEAFLNFGIAGCLLFALMGWFVSKHFFRFVFTRDRFSLLQSLNFAVVLGLHMRNQTGTFFRLLFYGYVAIELLRRLSATTGRARRRRSSGPRALASVMDGAGFGALAPGTHSVGS